MMIEMDPGRRKNLEKYFDDILPSDSKDSHPYLKFQLHEIVHHPVLGYGIITGTRIPDLDRDFEGLGVQFVAGGKMMEHTVFTTSECMVLEGTGIVYDVKIHGKRTLEDVAVTGD